MTAKVETQKVLVKADRSLVLTERVPIVEGNVAVDQVEFTFEEPADWKDLTITAYFTNSATEITEYVNLGILGSATKKTAKVPASVTQDVGFIGVALLGSIISGSGDNATVTQRAATQDNSKILKVYKSGVVVYNPDPEGPLTPSMIEEAEAALNEAIAAANRAEEAASAVLDVFDGATEEEAGKVGQVPAPAAGETNLVLTGDGNWTDVHDLIPDKADVDGYYELLTAGAADNLTGRGDTTAASFLYRTAGGDEDIADGIATIECVRGNTVGWNQLADMTGNLPDEAYGITRTLNANGGLDISGTATGSGTVSLTRPMTLKRDGRKYLIKSSKKLDRQLTIKGYNPSNYWPNDGSSFIFTRNDDTDWYNHVAMIVTEGEEISYTDVHISVFDLTAMFGAGNEPSTVEEFEALYPEPYYPYDPGTLKPVQFTGIETVGFNQWDEEWELGYWNSGDGHAASASNQIRAKNPIECFPSTVYRASSPQKVMAAFYDASDKYISTQGWTNGDITTPANARYMRCSFGNNYGTTYNDDIAIHLKWSGYRDGEYESYWRQQREIAIAEYFPDGMWGGPTIKDELYSDHAVKNMYDLEITNAMISQVRVLTNVTIIECDTVAGKVFGDGYNKALIPNFSTSLAGFVWRNSINDVVENQNTWYVGTYGYPIFLFPSSVTEEQARAKVIGQHVVGPIKTPTTETIDPPLNLGYKVSDFGTERVMVADGEISAPPVFEIAYGLNATDTIRRLPTQYISDDSFEQFRYAMEEYFNLESTETWDETNNRYSYQLAHDESAEITKTDIYKAMYGD